MLDGLSVEQIGERGQRGEAELLDLESVGLESPTDHGQNVLLDVGGRCLAEYQVHVAQNNENDLQGLLQLEDVSQPGQNVLDVFVVIGLLGD